MAHQKDRELSGGGELRRGIGNRLIQTGFIDALGDNVTPEQLALGRTEIRRCLRVSAAQMALSRRHAESACGPTRGRITERMKKISYSGYRFPPEVIHQAIWLYLRFTLSLRDVEDLLALSE
jgi:hypothetical protein